MKLYVVIVVLGVVLAVSYLVFEAWVTANPPTYSDNVPTTTFTLMLQGFAVRQRTKSRMLGIEQDFFRGLNDEANPAKSKNVILTGSTSGLGFGAATRLLAAGGGRLLFLPCRKCGDRAFVDKLKKRLSKAAKNLILKKVPEVAATGNVDVGVERLVFLEMDLGDLSSIDAGVLAIKSKLQSLPGEERIDILINNAGLVNIYGAKTVDGFEKAFGVNYLGTAYFTEKLNDSHLFSVYDPIHEFPRVVMVSSEEHRLQKTITLPGQSSFGEFFDFGLLTGGQMEGYAYSKFLLTSYSHELSKRWEGKLRVFDICPGPVASDIAADAPWPINKLVSKWMKYTFVSGEEAALPLLNLAFYKHPKHRSDDGSKPLIHFHMGEERPASRESQISSTGNDLWRLTHELLAKHNRPIPSDDRRGRTKSNIE